MTERRRFWVTLAGCWTVIFAALTIADRHE